MMMSLYSEPYSPTGSIDARAARRALGTTRMEFWDLFLREVLQNSWDARLYPNGGITFAVDAYQLSEHQRLILEEQIFPEVPRQGLSLGNALRTGPVRLLVVTDAGTRGLGGPTRADLQPELGERTDFVDFIRNIGRATGKGVGGGTYGFGKGVFFDASKVRTVLAYSRTTVKGEPATRLIGMALGEDYDDGGKRYTGRHWWGIRTADPGVSPLEGLPAEQIAAGLGLTRLRNFESGTAIAVICPEEPDDPRQPSIIEQIAAASARWAWPHMIGDGTMPSIQFQFTNNEVAVEAPDLARHARLHYYAEAYKRASGCLNGEIADDWPWTQKLISAERPKKTLGALAYRRFMVQGSPGDIPADAIMSGIALMRSPRFVVKYMSVSRGIQEQDLVGVFIAKADLDEEFARAEPVAHDDWLPARLQLARYQRNPVKQALDKLKAEFQAWKSLGTEAGSGEEHVSVTRIAAVFGALLGMPGGDAAVPGSPGHPVHSRDRVGAGGSAGDRLGSAGSPAYGSGSEPFGDPARPGRRHGAGGSAWVAGPPALRLENGRIRARFDVIAKVGQSPIVIEAEPRVVLDSGAAEIADEAPRGAEKPRVAGWSEAAARRYVRLPSISVAGEGDHRLQVDIHQPADTMITLALRIRPAE